MSGKKTIDNSSGKDGVATKPQRTAEELRIALHTCEVNRQDTIKTKKAQTSAANDLLKDIGIEINDILSQLKQLEPPKGA